MRGVKRGGEWGGRADDGLDGLLLLLDLWLWGVDEAEDIFLVFFLIWELVMVVDVDVVVG